MAAATGGEIHRMNEAKRCRSVKYQPSENKGPFSRIFRAFAGPPTVRSLLKMTLYFFWVVGYNHVVDRCSFTPPYPKET